jgi:predicted DNA-binding transcriptional regulator AlpA
MNDLRGNIIIMNDDPNGQDIEASMLPLLLDVNAVSQMLGIGPSKVWQMDAAGQLPSPVRLGRRCTRWRRIEIEAWVRAGCPLRNQWEANRV